MSRLRPVVAPTAAVLSLSVFGWSDSFSKPVFRASSLSAERPARRSGRTPPPPDASASPGALGPREGPVGGPCSLRAWANVRHRHGGPALSLRPSLGGPWPFVPPSFSLSQRSRRWSHTVRGRLRAAFSLNTHLLSSIAFHGSIAYFSLPPNNVPASGRTTVYLSPAGGPPG